VRDLFLLLVTLVCFCPTGRGAEPVQDNPLRQQRMELLESRTEKLDLRFDEKDARPLMGGKAPILRWSNPVRQFVNDGITCLWLEGNRPVAVITCWARSTEEDLRKGELLHEFVSLSAKPLIMRRGTQVIWSPRASVADQPLVSAPTPRTARTRRLTQMRELARRFQATSYKMESPYELRLMPQPLYRYEDQEAGILDGGLFSFAEGNDPEALLLLEAVASEEGKSHVWRYTLARMTSYRVVVRLDNREVFAVAPYWRGPRSPTDAYVEAFDGPFALEQITPGETSKPAVSPK
jgi:hypothetical protein